MRALALVALGLTACGDPSDPVGAPGPATPEQIAAAPTLTLAVENHSEFALNLPRITSGSGWFRVDGHPNWFVWYVPDEFSSSSICEDVTAEQVGEQPREEVRVEPGDEYRFDWKTNVFGEGKVEQGALGPVHCIHVHPVAKGSYRASICADLASVHCSVQPNLSDFTQRCVPVTLTIPDADGVLAVTFEAEDFPDDLCAADR